MLVEGARRKRRNTQKGERWGVLLKEIARNYPEIISKKMFSCFSFFSYSFVINKEKM